MKYLPLSQEPLKDSFEMSEPEVSTGKLVSPLCLKNWMHSVQPTIVEFAAKWTQGILVSAKGNQLLRGKS